LISFGFTGVVILEGKMGIPYHEFAFPISSTIVFAELAALRFSVDRFMNAASFRAFWNFGRKKASDKENS
jgi:hypothetical protein